MFVALVAVLLASHFALPVQAEEDLSRLQAGVVRITAKPPQGASKIGTGFIVRLDREEVYIVTAAHVVAGDQRPAVEFFSKRNVSVQASVIGLEADDEVKGLAVLQVRGSDIPAAGLTALAVTPTVRLIGGQDIMVIGFPRGAGPWAVIKGSIVSRQGRNVDFSAAIDEGSSGGPILQNGKVVGMVAGLGRFGRGVTAGSIQEFLEGYGVTLGGEVPKPPLPEQPRSVKVQPAAPDKARSPDVSMKIGRDGAPMVLVPAGQFMMGDGSDGHEQRGAPIYLDGFYIDKFEVTLGQYLEFLRATGRESRQ